MSDEPPRRKIDRIVAWLQRINGQYAAFMRWLAAGGIVYGGVRGRADLISAFIGLAVIPYVVGKPPP
jgi:hypothetical protein